MMHLVHSFLKWLPVAVFGAVVGAAGVWDEVKTWIAECAAWTWLQMSDPLVACLVILGVCVYIGAVLWTGNSFKDHQTEKNEPQPSFVLELPAGSASSAIFGNAIRGSAKITLGGEGHVFSENRFGPDANISDNFSNSTLDERERLLNEIMSEWLSSGENAAYLPFADPDVMYQRVGSFINSKLKERHLDWRVTAATTQGWMYSDR